MAGAASITLQGFSLAILPAPPSSLRIGKCCCCHRLKQRAMRFLLSDVRQVVDELIKRYGVLAYAYTGRVINRVGNRRGNSADAELTHPLGLQRRGGRI